MVIEVVLIDSNTITKPPNTSKDALWSFLANKVSVYIQHVSLKHVRWNSV